MKSSFHSSLSFVPSLIKMGYVLIFNNENFDTLELSNRKNSKKDVLKLKNVFYKFNFRLKVVSDPTLEDIRNNLKLLSEQNLDSALCLIVVIMTHGLEKNHAYCKDGFYNIEEEIFNSAAFQKFPKLPKILITQACKEKDEKFKPVDSPTIEVHNTLRFDSCFEGDRAVLGQKGAIFIQSLCEHLDKHGFDLDFEKIASNVRKEFVKKYRETSLKQIPTITKYVNDFEELKLGKKVRTAAMEAVKPKDFIIG